MKILHHFNLTSASPYQFSAESVRYCKQVGTGEVAASSVHSRGKHPHGSGCLRGKPSARPLILCQARGTSFEEAKLRELSWSCLSSLCPWWRCLWVPKARSFAGAGWLVQGLAAPLPPRVSLLFPRVLVFPSIWMWCVNVLASALGGSCPGFSLWLVFCLRCPVSHCYRAGHLFQALLACLACWCDNLLSTRCICFSPSSFLFVYVNHCYYESALLEK